MSATDEKTQEESREDSTAQLVGLFDDINTAKKVELRRPGPLDILVKNPLMVLGVGVTSYFMFKGVRAVSSGQSMELSKALQGRVAGQFFTLAVVMGTAVYIGMHSKDNIARATETDILMKKQAHQNYIDAQNK